RTQRIMVVCAIDRPRSAIISTRSRRLSLNRRYQRTHKMITSRSKWRPSNSSSKLFSFTIADPQPNSAASLADRIAAFAPERASRSAVRCHPALCGEWQLHRCSCRQFGRLALPVPRQEFVKLGCRMIVDPAKDVGEPGFRIDVVELCRGDQGIDRGGPFTTAI